MRWWILWYVFFFRGVMDESGEQFVAYFLPVEETLRKRRDDIAKNIPYQDDEEYEYKMAREYNWNVKSKASKGKMLLIDVKLKLLIKYLLCRL